MKTIQTPWIKLKETIDHEDYQLIHELQERCIKHDQTTLKLELDYKLGYAVAKAGPASIQTINEFMYFDGHSLIGYLGICGFGGPGTSLELNGMVHPQYRRQGVFKLLFELALSEGKGRNTSSILLLTDRNSSPGQAFIQGTGAQYKLSEHEMYRNKDITEDQLQSLGITFRKAENRDAQEIARQNRIYFQIETDPDDETEMDNKDLLLPEEEEQRGLTIFLAEKDQKVIGKVHLQLASGIGGIFGLGVLPEYRGKGYGRAILMKTVEAFKDMKADEIMLQVAADNSNALKLYQSCGFVETSIMDYYEMCKTTLK